MTKAILGVLASIKLVLRLLDHVSAQGLDQWLLNISGKYIGVFFCFISQKLNFFKNVFFYFSSSQISESLKCCSEHAQIEKTQTFLIGSIKEISGRSV